MENKITLRKRPEQFRKEVDELKKDVIHQAQDDLEIAQRILVDKDDLFWALECDCLLVLKAAMIEIGEEIYKKRIDEMNDLFEECAKEYTEWTKGEE